MDSYELNKILGAVLGTCLVMLSLNIAAGAIFTAPKPAKPGYDIAVPEEAAQGAPAAADAQAEPIATRLASADVGRGENAAKKCLACHTFAKGEPNKVGPNQWGVVNRAKAATPGFNYSAALKGKGGEWTFDELDKFLASPKGFVPGTSMAFPGVTRASERADIILYLNKQSDSPAALPQAAAAPAAAGGAPAAGAPAAGGAAPAAPAGGAAPAAPAANSPPAGGNAPAPAPAR